MKEAGRRKYMQYAYASFGVCRISPQKIYNAKVGWCGITKQGEQGELRSRMIEARYRIIEVKDRGGRRHPYFYG